jgi:hypothetical protein
MSATKSLGRNFARTIISDRKQASQFAAIVH